MTITDDPRFAAALRRHAYQEAYGLLPPCKGKGDAAWAEAAATIEARKADALAALTAAWRASKETNG